MSSRLISWWAELLATGLRLLRGQTPQVPASPGAPMIRYARADDEVALRDLAEADGRPLAPGPWLVAMVDARICAAVQLHGPADLAAPALPSAELVWRLHETARKVRKNAVPPSLAGDLLLPECPEPHWF